MNYLKELNAFRDWSLLSRPSTGQVALWHSLMSVNNMSGWIDWFTVPNQTLQLMTGLSRQGLDRARLALINDKLIEYRKGSSNQAGKYRMIGLECQKVGTEVVTNRASEWSQTGHDSSTLFKQDKTKQISVVKDNAHEMTDSECQQEIEIKMQVLTNNFNYRLVQNDYAAYKHLRTEGVPIKFILDGMEETFANYRPRHSMDAITKFSYCAKRILGRWTDEQSRIETAETERQTVKGGVEIEVRGRRNTEASGTGREQAADVFARAFGDT